MEISQSRFGTYHRCPYAHYLRYYERIVAKTKDRPLYFGTDIHKLLQYRGNPDSLHEAKDEIKDTYYNLNPVQQAKIGGDEYLDELFAIFKDYCRIYQKFPKPNKTEAAFRIRVGEYRGEPIIFTGVIDEIYRDGKRVQLGEHKSFSRRPDMNTLTMNTQKCMYAKAYLLKKGILPERVIWDYIRSTPADMPVFLEKSGRLSLAASKKITPYSFIRACNLYGIDDPKIRAHAKVYRPNTDEFFFRVPMDIIPEMVEIIWDGFMYTARDIIRQGHKNKTRYLTRDCVWCDYRDICNAELSGQSAKGIIDRGYTYRDEKENKNV